MSSEICGRRHFPSCLRVLSGKILLFKADRAERSLIYLKNLYKAGQSLGSWTFRVESRVAPGGTRTSGRCP